VSARVLATLSLFSAALFAALGLGGMLQNRWAASPSQTMKGLAASVPSSYFAAMLGLELPGMEPAQRADAPLDGARMTSFLMRFVAGLDPDDPAGLLARELPGADRERAVLLRAGSGGSRAASPVDLGPRLYPPLDLGLPLFPEDDPSATEAAPPPSEDARDEEGGRESAGQEANPPDNSAAYPSLRPEPAVAARSTLGRKAVFIYHTHNRESFYPELQRKKGDPQDTRINITLVGRRLAERLEEHGIGAVHSDKDYATSVKNFDWNRSYQYSLNTVKQAIADYGNLEFFFDIHRDSSRRSKTTVTIDGVAYAQVYFIIGQRNPNWRENEAFAHSIHEALERTHPGLSRGIWGKTAKNGNGEYNQSIAPESVLIEIGGVDNTLEECYRTVDVLADVIAELYWQKRDAVEAGVTVAAHAETRG
jgi:stage II sporulation protein P